MWVVQFVCGFVQFDIVVLCSLMSRFVCGFVLFCGV